MKYTLAINIGRKELMSTSFNKKYLLHLEKRIEKQEEKMRAQHYFMQKEG